MYIANVGDSTIVLGKANPKYGEAGEPEVIAEVITRDHKPEDKKEKRRIEALGGAVSLSNKGVMRGRVGEKAAGANQVKKWRNMPC